MIRLVFFYFDILSLIKKKNILGFSAFPASVCLFVCFFRAIDYIRTFLELAWKQSEHLIVSEAPNNKTANCHTKPRTNNSAEEVTTGNTSVIYGIGYPVMYHQINNEKRLLNNSFVLT